MARGSTMEFKTGLNDLIEEKKLELEKIMDKIAMYDDPDWIAERKAKLEEKRDMVEQELTILQLAEKGLKAKGQPLG